MTSVREHNSSIRTNSIHRWLIGYVARFIFETAKISQLFCHQILWNMKANCYKDDAGEVVCIRNSGIWWQCLAIDLILDKHRRTLWNQPWIEWSICSLTLFPEKRRNSTRKSLDSSMKSLQFRAPVPYERRERWLSSSSLCTCAFSSVFQVILPALFHSDKD